MEGEAQDWMAEDMAKLSEQGIDVQALLNSYEKTQSLTSTQLIGDVHAMYQEYVKLHNLDWNSFYEGWLVGRLEMVYKPGYLKLEK